MRELAVDPTLREQMAGASQELIRAYSPETCAAGFAEASFSLEAHV
jgi:hypothetical protein